MMCELYMNSYGLNLQKHGFNLFIAPFSNQLKHVAIRICSSALQIKTVYVLNTGSCTCPT